MVIHLKPMEQSFESDYRWSPRAACFVKSAGKQSFDTDSLPRPPIFPWKVYV